MLRIVTSEIEREQCTQCPHCEQQNIVKNGRDRRGTQVYRCVECDRSFTALTGTPFSGHSFPPGVIGLAVRWYLRYRELSVKWLAAGAPPRMVPVFLVSRYDSEYLSNHEEQMGSDLVTR